MTPEEVAFLASKNFYAFPKLASGMQCPRHIKFISDKIQNKIEDKSDSYKLLLISAPPRHGKSMMISKHLPAWYLGNYPKNRVILTSYSADLAEDHSDYAKDLFAKWGPILWNVNQSRSMYNRSKWNTDRNGGCIASGVGGTIIGFGADLFIIDDYFKGPEEAESKAARDKLWEKWQGIVASRLHPGALVIILASRWHSDDIAGRLMAQHDSEGREFPFDYEYINLSALIEDEKQKEDDPLNRDIGEALWPARYNAKLLKSVKKIAGAYFWNSQYQGVPVSRGGNIFKSQYFRYYDIDRLTNDILCWKSDDDNPIRVRRRDIKICVIVDPAIDKKKKNDPCAMHAWAYSRKHKIWMLLDRINTKLDYTEINKTTKIFAYKNNASYILVENEKIGKILVKESAGNDSIGNRKIPFKEVPTKGLDKETRAIPMGIYCENERVFFPKNAPWIVEYEKNIKDFPSGLHDEDADLTAYASTMEDKLSIAEVLAGLQ